LSHIFRNTSLPALLWLVLSGCNPGMPQNDFGDARWIGVPEHQFSNDSLLFGKNPAPLLRKEFSAADEIISATLYITAAGYYNAFLNGEKIGKNYLDPAWTDYSKRIYYTSYDVTPRIRRGDNCIAVMLGNGFYNPLPLKMWGQRNLRDNLPVGQPNFIARLKLEYKNGKIQEILSDASWQQADGPILKNDVYLGEVYDASAELKNWNQPGMDDAGWGYAAEYAGPGGHLQEAFFPPIQASGSIDPVEISSPDSGVYIVDMGVNFTGLYRVRLSGQSRDTIVFRFGERLYEDGSLNPMTTVCGQIKRPGMGGPGAPAIAWQEDRFIFGDETDIWYSPDFTFHTYRYMEITGLNDPPDPADIQGVPIHTAVDTSNYILSSNTLVNSIQQACRRTFLSNLIGVQSDCAAREKFGYGGDLNAIAESYIYNFNMQAFYRKTVYDWLDAMNDSVFIDTAPFVGIQYCGISWESAFLTTQYKLLLYYNDTAIIRELYDLNLKWLDKVARLHPKGIVESGLSDHESLEPVPVQLTGTSHYLECAQIMARFAAMMEDPGNAERFEKLAAELRIKLRNEFWEQPVEGPINRQTLFATLLYHEIVPEAEIEHAVDSLFKALQKAPAGHFTTGIFGTKYILEALSQAGHGDAVWEIVNSKDFPGWGYMIEQGATTIWETWKESDNTYSNCHPMFGSVSEWYYRWLAGIRPDPDYPGFKKFIIDPCIPEGLDSLSCSYQSPYGNIISSWKKEGEHKTVFQINVPQGSSAKVRLPTQEPEDIHITERTGLATPIPVLDGEDHCSFELGSGNYYITITAGNVAMRINPAGKYIPGTSSRNQPCLFL
jgi:alpha-L-rhamnosidase